jgi:hypothetical protein
LSIGKLSISQIRSDALDRLRTPEAANRFRLLLGVLVVFSEDPDSVFAGSLRGVECLIRVTHQSFGQLAMSVFCNSNTDRRRAGTSERL